jgi:hypothetical protein
MRVLLSAFCFLVVGGYLLIAPPQRAFAEAHDSGFEAGLRVGYGLPFGELRADSDLNDGISGQIPLWLDVGYRLNPALFLGGYVQYGFGFVGGAIDESCDDTDGVDCSATDIRLGLQLHYHIAPRSTANPWLGLGVGYEWMSLGVEAGGDEAVFTSSGFEFINLQAGLDFGLADHLFAGPFISLSLGQYDEVSVDCDGAICSTLGRAGDAEIEDTATHGWFVLGVRATYF